MLLIFSVVLVLGALAVTLYIRPADLPQPDPVLPWQHLEERKARIYENLRDLQFEYRVGKLSDEDYQGAKQELQKELARVLQQIDEAKPGASAAGSAARPKAASPAPGPKLAAPTETAETVAAGNVCPHCGAEFAQKLKFCGECGKAMEGAG